MMMIASSATLVVILLCAVVFLFVTGAHSSERIPPSLDDFDAVATQLEADLEEILEAQYHKELQQLEQRLQQQFASDLLQVEEKLRAEFGLPSSRTYHNTRLPVRTPLQPPPKPSSREEAKRRRRRRKQQQQKESRGEVSSLSSTEDDVIADVQAEQLPQLRRLRGGNHNKKSGQQQGSNQPVKRSGLGELPSSSSNSSSGDDTDQEFTVEVSYVAFLELQRQVVALQKLMQCVDKTKSNSTDIFFVGCNVHIENGDPSASTLSANRLGNLILGYNEDDNCFSETGCQRSGSHNLVVGPNQDWQASGGMIAGESNLISGHLATITGGYNNQARAVTSSISGGRGNLADEEDCVVVGGEQNNCTGVRSVVVGGVFNVASGRASAVLAGLKNIASGDDAAVTGGALNEAAGMYGAVVSGRNNLAGGLGALVGGGNFNQANGTQSVVAGGVRHIVTAYNKVFDPNEAP